MLKRLFSLIALLCACPGGTMDEAFAKPILFHTDTVFGRMPHHEIYKQSVDSLNHIYTNAMWASGCIAAVALSIAIMILILYIIINHNHQKKGG